MDNVKIIRMQTGEDIMASMIEKEEQNETVVLNNPMRLVFRRLPTGQTVLMMMPWLPVELIKEDSAIIYTTDIITVIEPKESMKEYYENLVDKTIEEMMNSEELLEQRLSNMEKEEQEEQKIAEEIINNDDWCYCSCQTTQSITSRYQNCFHWFTCICHAIRDN
jgi:guanylate kinase